MYYLLPRESYTSDDEKIEWLLFSQVNSIEEQGKWMRNFRKERINVTARRDEGRREGGERVDERHTHFICV